MTFGVQKLKPVPPGKAENSLRNNAACAFYSVGKLCQIVTINHHQSPAKRDFSADFKATFHMAIVKFAILRPKIGEAPAKNLAIKRLGAVDIGDGKFDIIDTTVGLLHEHPSLGFLDPSRFFAN